MKKFRFKLEAVLNERKRLEDLRQREWTMARLLLQNMLDQLKAMEDRLEKAYDESTTVASNPIQSLGFITSIETFIKGTKIRIGWKLNEVQRATKLVEKAKHQYLVARQRREGIEKLKDRKLREFKVALHKRELKELDDIYIMNGAARRRAEEEEQGDAPA